MSSSSIQWKSLIYLSQSSKRVFILGPSQHVYLDGCALSKCTEYATPLGALPLDRSSMLICLVSSSGITSFFFQPLSSLKRLGSSHGWGYSPLRINTLSQCPPPTSRHY